MSEGWYEVDETGHVPYVAAELPRGHRVYLDAAHNIGAIVLVEQVPALDEAIVAQQENAPDSDAPMMAGGNPSAEPIAPVASQEAPQQAQQEAEASAPSAQDAVSVASAGDAGGVPEQSSSAQEQEQATEQENNGNTEITS